MSLICSRCECQYDPLDEWGLFQVHTCPDGVVSGPQLFGLRLERLLDQATRELTAAEFRAFTSRALEMVEKETV